MSAASTVSPTSPVDRRDIRSAAQPFKRDKDHDAKWSNGIRPSPGVTLSWNSESVAERTGGSDSQREKDRPCKQPSSTHSLTKTRGNKTPKPFGGPSRDVGRQSSRISHKFDAHFEATDSTLSKSLAELMPQHANNLESPIQTAIRGTPQDGGFLYSFDAKGPSPSERGRKVELGGLIEEAERKWAADQTEKMVMGEYEVLNEEGETTNLKKGKRSPKQRAVVKTQPSIVKGLEGPEDEGFELI